MQREFQTPFLAQVEHLRVENNEQRMSDGRVLVGGGHRIATVKILEDFSGYYGPGDEIEVTTGMGGGDCGYAFKEGERYLIDGYLHEGRLSTGICSRTAPEGEASLALRELRAVKANRRIPDVSGSVGHRLNTSGALFVPSKPVAGVPVTLTGLEGTVLRSVTDVEGLYEFSAVPPGSYTVHFYLSPELMLAAWAEKHFGITVPQNDGSGAGCEVNALAYAAGRLVGRVVDGQGKPVQGSLRVYPMEPGSQRWETWVAEQAVGADGSFRVGPLDAGKYWLSFWPKAQEQQRWVFPGTTDLEAANPVAVEEGKTTRDLIFTISQ